MMMIMEHKQKQQWIEQEDTGKNSPSSSLSPSSRPPVPVFGALCSLIADIKTDIYARLLETGKQEAVNNPNFLDALDAHFRRLPSSYALDLNVEKSEDVLMHQKILEEAEVPEKCPVFHVQFLKLSALLSDLGLNIREAHVFCTNDGYSLDVFVVDG